MKLRKRYRSTGKYYKVMKSVMKEGVEAIDAEREDADTEMKDIKEYGPHYDTVRARQNIVRVFEKLDYDHKVVGGVFCRRRNRSTSLPGTGTPLSTATTT